MKKPKMITTWQTNILKPKTITIWHTIISKAQG